MTQPKPKPGAMARAGEEEPAPRIWMPRFLAALAETSNVSRAAKLAG